MTYINENIPSVVQDFMNNSPNKKGDIDTSGFVYPTPESFKKANEISKPYNDGFMAGMKNSHINNPYNCVNQHDDWLKWHDGYIWALKIKIRNNV